MGTGLNTIWHDIFDVGRIIKMLSVEIGLLHGCRGVGNIKVRVKETS